jgi:CDP-diacylglycerol--serine O-phosphatidyltransferase
MIKNIPNVITLSNLTLGLLAIFHGLINSNLVLCSFLIVSGVFLDFLDGKIARYLKVESDFGKQLDSFADMVTFGIAPSVIIYKLLEVSGSQYTYLAFFVPIFSAIRLAKYNIDNKQGNYFIGLTTTVNALLLSSLPLIQKFQSSKFIESLLSDASFLISFTLLFSILLISNVTTFSLKFYSANKLEKKLKVLFIIASILFFILLKYLAIPIIIFFYMLLSIIFKPK